MSELTPAVGQAGTTHIVSGSDGSAKSDIPSKSTRAVQNKTKKMGGEEEEKEGDIDGARPVLSTKSQLQQIQTRLKAKQASTRMANIYTAGRSVENSSASQSAERHVGAAMATPTHQRVRASRSNHVSQANGEGEATAVDEEEEAMNREEKIKEEEDNVKEEGVNIKYEEVEDECL